MATATIAPIAPRDVAPPLLLWPPSALLLDADGAALSDVGLLGPPRDDRVGLVEVEEPDALLGYYFGHGGRRVMLQLFERVVEGRLATRWAGIERDWWVELGED